MVKLISLLVFSLFSLYISAFIDFSSNSIFFQDDTDTYCKTELIEKSRIKSPVNIGYYNSDGTMVFPGNPHFVLDRTFYKRVNGVKFEFKDKKLSNDENDPSYKDLEMDITGIGYAYVKLYNQTYKYNPKTLRLRVFSEHTFEKTKMDMEIQIMHELSSDITNNKLPQRIGLAVLFSIARNKKSSFVDDFIGKDEKFNDETTRYNFALTKSLDLNQFFNFWEPYYYYEGSGTSPEDYCKRVDWFVMKKVQNMSQEQLRQIQLILSHEGYPHGFAKQLEKNLKDGNPEHRIYYHPNVEPEDDE